MTAMETLLTGLFDYAGLYPPASLGLCSAVNNYLDYRRSKHASALGRFILNIEHLDELRSLVGDSLQEMKLSVIATESADWDSLAAQIHRGVSIEAVEVKCNHPVAIDSISRRISRELAAYFEVAMDAPAQATLKSVAAAGARAKIRMGGVIPEAFPSVSDVAPVLKTLAELQLPFKATAGLHHPVRASRPLTYHPQSPTGAMHGFMNLCCAAALLYFGGDSGEAETLLDERDPAAWRVSADAVHWRDRKWATAQLSTIRRQFLISIGSCSFEEPIHDMESLGWL